MTEPQSSGVVFAQTMHAGAHGLRQLVVRFYLMTGLIGVVVAMAWWAPTFISVDNVQVILLQSSVTLILAAPLGILLMAGHIDLSVGSSLALGAVIGGALIEEFGVSPIFSGLVVLVSLAGLGAINGLLVARLGLSPIIATLGTFSAARGVAFVVSAGQNYRGFGPLFEALGRGSLGRVPVPVLIAAALFAVLTVALYRTTWGRHARAIGDSSEGAFLAGVPINRRVFSMYVLMGAAVGIATLITMGRLDSSTPNLAIGLEIKVLTAVLLGGVAFGGGRGSLGGVLLGVLFLKSVGNALLHLGVAPNWVRVSDGVALILAAGLLRWSETRKSTL